MADFKTIETQEELDKVIAERLDRKAREVESKFADYLAPDKVEELKASHKKELDGLNEKVKELKDTIASHSAEVSEIKARAEKAENSLMKNRIAHENGIPLELASRLQGNTEDEVKADAKTLSSFFSPKSAPPLKSAMPSSSTDTKEAAMHTLLSELTNNN